MLLKTRLDRLFAEAECRFVIGRSRVQVPPSAPCLMPMSQAAHAIQCVSHCQFTRPFGDGARTVQERCKFRVPRSACPLRRLATRARS